MDRLHRVHIKKKIQKQQLFCWCLHVLHLVSPAGNQLPIVGVGSVCSAHRNEQVAAWNLSWTPTASLEPWTGGTGASVHQPRALLWPTGSLGCTIVRTFVGVLALSCGSWGGWWSGLTHVSCPYTVDKLPQLCCYLKPPLCCAQSPAGLKADADGSKGSLGERKVTH